LIGCSPNRRRQQPLDGGENVGFAPCLPRRIPAKPGDGANPPDYF
jgi:hypothetical protein